MGQEIFNSGGLIKFVYPKGYKRQEIDDETKEEIEKAYKEIDERNK
jgi:hypothetical protein